ncbi:coiled-coil domain-containing protein 106-like [Pygocentrus nattereri]|uniref:coiled-coil domain-containing protein 106-like n=1 Tax=Pygocentrus nattereri TaxID=42514 RepID=UPI001890E797|nr:coiled-coil domain-containing protein 106-like [Pygocentrus nattereri]
MENLDGKESRSSATVAASTRSKRVPRRQQTGQVSTDERESSASDLDPTATVLLNKEKQELTFLKEKLEWQKKKIEELEEERDFLRGHLSAHTVKTKEETLDNPVAVNDSESSDTSSISSSSLSSSSSSTSKKRKHKFKKKHSKKHKKEHKKFRQRVQTPSEIIRRYKSILKTLPKAKTMTRAFQKHAIDRNTVVSTSAIGELAIAAPEVYEELLAKKPCGETVLAFAKRCEAAIQGDEDVKEKMESMKARGTLLPIRRSKPV